MKKLIEYSVKNPLLVNLLMIAIFILGGAALLELPRELNPKIVFNYIFIIVPYPGAGAEEVEKIITVEVEDAVDEVDDIKMISSESSQGASFVWLQFEDISERDFKERLNEVEGLVSQLDLPEGALDPVVEDFDSDDFIPVISLSIVGDIPEKTLNNLTEDLKEDLLDLDGIAKVSVSGTRERELWVEVDPAKLAQHRLSMSAITQAISARNMNLPAGEMVIGRQSFLVRTVGEIESPDGFEKIVVRWDPNGNHVYLGQVAKIVDRWDREATRARMDGQQAATLSISRKASANSLDVIKKVKQVAENYRSELPFGTKIVVTNDTSIWLNEILGKLTNNAQLGFLLVILILFVFLGFRNALVAAIGIPISFMATFILMSHTGQTLNGSSLFALMLILGVVVDDAIIVVENCYRLRNNGYSSKDAAILGTTEVFWPVVAASATTIAAFLPLMLMSGIMGKFLRVIPFVVTLTLIASMIEVFLIAPSHFAEWSGGHSGESQKWFVKLRKLYTKGLVKMIRRRYLIGPLIFGVLIVLMILTPILVGVDLYDGDEWSQFWVRVTMPPGTTLEETDRVIRLMEEETKNLKEGEVHALIANAGLLQTDSDWIYADHVGQLIVDLVEHDFRDREMDEIMADMRERVSHIPGPVSVTVAKPSNGPPVPKPVEIKVKGKHLDELRQVAKEVKAVLETLPGVFDVSDDLMDGKQELALEVDEARASQYGLNVALIAVEVRNALEGIEAAVYRDGDEEVDVRVKLAESDSIGVEGLKSFQMMAPTGELVRLDNFCKFVEVPSLYRIKRFEQERAVTVSADVDKKVTNAAKVSSEVEKRYVEIGKRHPGYRLDLRGEFMEFQNAFVDLSKLFLIGVMLIFVILGAQFKSVRISLIILMTIPFAFIGSMIGLIVGGNPFSILTMYGMVALAGIAVNDAIVMVSFINNHREAGGSRWFSIIESGRVRLRPIILTSVTTILGLLPMAIGLGGKSRSWGPLASTIVWGLLVATLLTLFVIPTVYSIVVDDWFGAVPLKKWYKARRARKTGLEREV